MSELPADYKELSAEACNPLLISESICDPVILIEKFDGKNQASLAGHVFKQGEHTYPKARTLEHNWISDGDFIRPLPLDVGVVLSKLFDGANARSLTFPEVLSLKSRAEELLIPVTISKQILEPATSASKKFSLPNKPQGLRANLYPYQEQGVAWMADTLDQLGGLVLADEMGLGKTLQILTLFLLKRPSKDKPALIVCPTSLIANWGLEIIKFAPDLTWAIHRGNDRARIHANLRQTEILLTTYDTMVNDYLLLSAVDWTYLVFDEAQALKNPSSNRRQALTNFQSTYTIPVTGTPVETSLKDLWSLADLAIPGLLGTQHEFETTYPDTIDSAAALSEVTDPFILKRRLEDVAEQLPARTNTEIPIDLGPALAAGYERTRQQILETYSTAGHLVATGQLALYCAHPWLSVKDPAAENWEENVQIKKTEGYQLLTPKVEVCLELLENAFSNRRKVIIFSAYNKCRELIEEAGINLPKSYWNSINGSTAGEERQSIIDEFTAHDGNAVLVLNPNAAGSGLNIQAATVVIHFTQYWNPAREAQASARAHRTGQKNPVSVYYLYYENTVERIMLDRTEFRREMADAAVTITMSDSEDIDRALNISPVVQK